MHTVMDGCRPDEGPDRDVDLLIEKGFLLLGSIEFQIEQHLMSHGTRIDPETRFFMAQVRDAAGDAASRLLDEARSRIDAAPGEQARQGPSAEESGEAVTALTLPPRRDVVRVGPRQNARRGARQNAWPSPRRRPFASLAISVGLGTAAAALCAALLLARPAPEAVPEKVGSDKFVAVEMPPIMQSARGRAAKRMAARPYARPGIVYPTSRGPFAVGSLVWPDDVLRRLVFPPRALLAAHAAVGAPPPYPDPLAGPDEARAVAPQVVAEAALALSRESRVEVQRRLAVADFDPHLFDGIFGPATRAALGAWQSAAGLPSTGYLDGPALALLRDQTENNYRAWAAKRSRAAHRTVQTAPTSPLPPILPLNARRCHRGTTGKIVYGRGVTCDFRGLRENIARLFG